MYYGSLYAINQESFTSMEVGGNFAIFHKFWYIQYFCSQVHWHIKTVYLLHFKALTNAFTVRFASVPRASKGR
jgi:hypothetical protein